MGEDLINDSNQNQTLARSSSTLQWGISLLFHRSVEEVIMLHRKIKFNRPHRLLMNHKFHEKNEEIIMFIIISRQILNHLFGLLLKIDANEHYKPIELLQHDIISWHLYRRISLNNFDELQIFILQSWSDSIGFRLSMRSRRW